MKEGWLKILKPVTLEIAIFREKNQNFEWKTTLNIHDAAVIYPAANASVFHATRTSNRFSSVPLAIL